MSSIKGIPPIMPKTTFSYTNSKLLGLPSTVSPNALLYRFIEVCVNKSCAIRQYNDNTGMILIKTKSQSEQKHMNKTFQLLQSKTFKMHYTSKILFSVNPATDNPLI